MPVRLVSFLAAEGIAIDQLTSRVTAFNMIDHVLLPQVPARLVRLAALSLYELDAEPCSFTERVRLISPDGNLSTESVSPITLAPRAVGQLPNGHRSIHVLWSPDLPSEGDYRLVLEHKIGETDWNQVASICITALVQPHPILNAQTPSVSVPVVANAEAEPEALKPEDQESKQNES
ncbi:MAG: hypothetical protein ACRELY_22420 [Polyangiaceae bacterium]